MVSVRPQNLDFGGSGVASGRPPNDPLSKEANSEPVCLIEAYRGLHGFCQASESGFWRFWGGLRQTMSELSMIKKLQDAHNVSCSQETMRKWLAFNQRTLNCVEVSKDNLPLDVLYAAMDTDNCNLETLQTAMEQQAQVYCQPQVLLSWFPSCCLVAFWVGWALAVAW